MPDHRPLPTAEQIEAAAARLRPLERAVFDLAAQGHLSNGAIARRLGIRRPTAERLLARALRKLDRALDRL
jgi:RNA polymerase sigma factor (sigma-70 family)